MVESVELVLKAIIDKVSPSTDAPTDGIIESKKGTILLRESDSHAVPLTLQVNTSVLAVGVEVEGFSSSSLQELKPIARVANKTIE
jgi:hypothetical protein